MQQIVITAPDLLTIDEARALLGVSRMQVWRLTKRGVLRPLYLGNRPYYIRAEVEGLKVAPPLPNNLLP